MADTEMSKKNYSISLIILTYNSGETINDCLNAIKQLNFPKQSLEIIIIDNGSDDNTLELIIQKGFQYIEQPDFNLSELRNYGAEIARNDILAYIDSDCIVYQDWADQVEKWFNNPRVCIVGNEYLLPENATFFEKNWYDKSNYGIKENDLIPAGNMAIRKKTFHKIGGFDCSLVTGEDDYILRRVRQNGLVTISDHEIKSIHLGNAKNLHQYFKKEIWYGLGMTGTLNIEVIDKPLIATIAFFLFVCLSGYYSLSYLATGSPLSGVVFSVIMILLLPLMSAVERIYIKKRKGNLVYVTIVFIVFFTARICSLFQIIKKIR